MFQLIYVSAPRIALSQDVLREIAQESIEANLARGVTGVLLMADNTVMQVLEGPQEAVQALYDTIAADVRHKNCEILVARQTDTREFGDWSMGFCEVGSDDAKQLLEVITALRVNRAIHVEQQTLAS